MTKEYTIPKCVLALYRKHTMSDGRFKKVSFVKEANETPDVKNWFFLLYKDIGTKVEIQKLVLKLASEGMSVTFISSETDEMLRTCSRLIVMRDRKKVGELSGEELSQQKIMDTIAGGDTR